MLVDALMSSRPPLVALAPVPRRATTVRAAATYSISSSPAASVWGPAFAPLATRSEPATYVSPAASVSCSTVWSAASVPTFVAEMVYSSTSPGRTAPPFRSATVLRKLDASNLGTKMSVSNRIAPA